MVTAGQFISRYFHTQRLKMATFAYCIVTVDP